MKGRRLPDGTDWSRDMQPGDYTQPFQNRWVIVTPNGAVGSLGKHNVTEHEDGTITVSPSILVYPHETNEGPHPGWHGFLERGVWREC